MRIEFLDECTSTNTLAYERGLKENGGEEFAIVAYSQTMGRGRRGRDFFSPTDTGIYLSILLRPKKRFEELTFLTPAVAVATAEVLEEFSEKRIDIKWVNDLYLDGKKIAGILTESSSNMKDGRPDFLVTGIGINLFPPAGGFPKEIQLKAGALFDDKIYTLPEERRNIKNDIAVRIIDNVLKYSKLKPIPDILSKYRERSFITNRYVRIVGGKQALVLGIGDGFELLVRYDDGRCEGLLAGEVSLELENYEKSEQRTDKNGE